jgi:hypothetical protein
LLYIGQARGKKGIMKRLFRDELRGKGPATFFRSLGVVLGHGDKVKPLKSGGNFTFENSEEIVDWIKDHLRVGWQLIDEGSINATEKRMIHVHRPIFNIQHNSDKDCCRRLMDLRSECREYARTLYRLGTLK